MIITTSDFQALEFNGADIDKLEFNGVLVWEKVQPVTAHIYGISWDKTSSVCTRTDDAANFSDPVPALGVNSQGSSPFDNLYPWSAMTTEDFYGIGTLVKIPKYLYKITNDASTFTLQIADAPVTGFSVSPSHRVRWDGDVEKPYVYVGRYHSNSAGGSSSGVYPDRNITRANARTKVKALGTGYCLLDYQLLQTIQMLYLVEFANWNCQNKIGYGCGASSSGSGVSNTGSTDSMIYHTGSVKSSVSTYGVGVQYRYIEDLWANVCDYVDCITFNPSLTSITYLFANPFTCTDTYSDRDFTESRVTTSGAIKDFKIISSNNSFNDLMLINSVGSGAKVSDNYVYGANGVVCAFGGRNGYQTSYSGLFYLDCSQTATFTAAQYGYRLQYIPQSFS